MHSLPVKRLTIYRPALRLKRKVSHAAAERVVSEPVIIAVELLNGAVGYGETLPRAYVTGETIGSVVDDVRECYVASLLTMRPTCWPEALEAIEALPRDGRAGTPAPAARAAVELALLEAYSRGFGKTIGEVAGWMGLPGFGAPGSVRHIRYSGVLAAQEPAKLLRTARLLRLYGLRHFKLKVGFDNDAERVPVVARLLERVCRRGTGSLRLDANGAWSCAQAVERLHEWSHLPIAAVEQPLPKGAGAGADAELAVLREATGARIIADESLISMDDARRLHGLGAVDGFNIRISKCGGLMPALRLAGFARAQGIDIQLGCMVGETGILSAAGVRFLQNTPRVRFAEGAFGSFLLADDVVRPGVRFRYGGRLPRLGESGWGCRVRTELLEQHCPDRPIRVEL